MIKSKQNSNKNNNNFNGENLFDSGINREKNTMLSLKKCGT